jgi:hypothetical protein
MTPEKMKRSCLKKKEELKPTACPIKFKLKSKIISRRINNCLSIRENKNVKKFFILLFQNKNQSFSLQLVQQQYSHDHHFQ